MKRSEIFKERLAVVEEAWNQVCDRIQEIDNYTDEEFEKVSAEYDSLCEKTIEYGELSDHYRKLIRLAVSVEELEREIKSELDAWEE